MANYTVSTPRPDVLRVVFEQGWDPETDSTPMFRDLLDTLEATDEMMTLLVVAGEHRPAYHDVATARDVLYHDRLKGVAVVSTQAEMALRHMGATRGERGMPPIPMHAFENEDAALGVL
ncbi:MAG: hypothetical protein HC915_05755 [Anaerolineae bacterium]|nr:hypothetical protein [Anaerolineae bacterium]